VAGGLVCAKEVAMMSAARTILDRWFFMWGIMGEEVRDDKGGEKVLPCHPLIPQKPREIRGKREVDRVCGWLRERLGNPPEGGN
jgi:hypothetical protein